MNLLTLVTCIVVVFYLYLAVRWQYVRRASCYVIGAGALLVGILLAGILGTFLSRGTQVTGAIFLTILSVVSLGSGIAACYGGKLPMVDELAQETDQAMHLKTPPQA
mgnify:CR=1 FL=1